MDSLPTWVPSEFPPNLLRATQRNPNSSVCYARALVQGVALLITLLMVSAPVAAQPVKLDSCHDGDTCRFVPSSGGVLVVRIMGIDAPEIDKGARCSAEQALAVKARDRLLDLLRAAKEITLDRHGQDRYQRTLAYVLADGKDVGKVLVAEGLARPYNGKGKRIGWCPSSQSYN